MNKADENDVEALKFVNKNMIPQLFPDAKPDELQKWLNGTQAGNAKLFSMLATAREHIAKTQKLQAETEESQANAKMMGQVMSNPSLLGSPGDGAEATTSPTPSPLLPAQPGASQGPPQGQKSASLPPYLSTPEGQQVQQFVVNRAKGLGLDPALAQALIHQESGWDPQATSPTGVQGLAQ